MKTVAGIELYTVKDLMKELGLSNVTIRDYLKKGLLKGRKIGNQWYVTGTHLQDFLNKTTEEVEIDRMFNQ